MTPIVLWPKLLSENPVRKRLSGDRYAAGSICANHII